MNRVLEPPPWARPAPPVAAKGRQPLPTGARVALWCATLAVLLGAVAGLAVVLYRPEGRQVDFAALQPGECFNRTMLGVDVVRLLEVGCDHSHRHEVFAVIHYPAPPGVGFPGRDAIQQVAKSSCADPLDSYLAGASLPAGLQLGYVYPEQQRWDKGERTIICEVFNADGSSRHRSIRSA